MPPLSQTLLLCYSWGCRKWLRGESGLARDSSVSRWLLPPCVSAPRLMGRTGQGGKTFPPPLLPPLSLAESSSLCSCSWQARLEQGRSAPRAPLTLGPAKNSGSGRQVSPPVSQGTEAPELHCGKRDAIITPHCFWIRPYSYPKKI